jgi:hypothetical protein
VYLKVDDDIDAFDVKPAAGEIGRDQKVTFAVTKALEGL